MYKSGLLAAVDDVYQHGARSKLDFWAFEAVHGIGLEFESGSLGLRLETASYEPGYSYILMQRVIQLLID